ncbi:hypothetical protein [Acetobacter oryzoeni]|uniref:hypothetical protein n=1 Tax=Acetobacter oryzoeni TaxID=2500548 RepID=UPI00142EE6FE|nr:hypothetical protein [Acetobacter oryzoeni]MCP1202821.1 hypothetical protein [Acetobacter oryzoeni]
MRSTCPVSVTPRWSVAQAAQWRYGQTELGRILKLVIQAFKMWGIGMRRLRSGILPLIEIDD